MKQIEFRNRIWSLTGTTRLRPSMLHHIGESGNTVVYSERVEQGDPAAIYVSAGGGMYRRYRPIQGRG